MLLPLFRGPYVPGGQRPKRIEEFPSSCPPGTIWHCQCDSLRHSNTEECFLINKINYVKQSSSTQLVGSLQNWCNEYIMPHYIHPLSYRISAFWWKLSVTRQALACVQMWLQRSSGRPRLETNLLSLLLSRGLWEKEICTSYITSDFMS